METLAFSEGSLEATRRCLIAPAIQGGSLRPRLTNYALDFSPHYNDYCHVPSTTRKLQLPNAQFTVDVLRWTCQMKLDPQDQQIITLLGQNGRLSNVRIAAAIGMSHSSVKKRIDRLIESGVCRVLGVVNPEKLGYGTDVFVGIKAKPDRLVQVAEALTALPEAFWVGQMMGRYDIFAEMVLPSSANVFETVALKIARIEGIISMETLLSMRQAWWRPIEWRPAAELPSAANGGRWDVPTWRGNGNGRPDAKAYGASGGGRAHLDELDSQIIAILQANGRRPAAEIARHVGLSQSAVKARIDRLLESGVCKVVGVVDPEKLGFGVDAHIWLRTDPAKAVEVSDALVRMPEVFWLCQSTGRFDVLAEVMMRSANEVLDFINTSVSRLPGVRSTDLSLVVRQTRWSPAQWRPWISSADAELRGVGASSLPGLNERR